MTCGQEALRPLQPPRAGDAAHLQPPHSGRLAWLPALHAAAAVIRQKAPGIMEIVKNAVVSMHYKVGTAAGEHVDASKPGEPLVFLSGHGQIIPGLEAVLLGKKKGEKISADIAAKDAYGEVDEELDIKVSKNMFPKDVQKNLKEGFQFRAEHPTKEGEEVIFTIHGVEGDDVLVSGNHPLAGEALHFEVEIADVRLATREELDHGHVHGAGGHHH